MEFSWVTVKYPKFYLKHRALSQTNTELVLDMTNNIQDIVKENIIGGIVIFNNDGTSSINYNKVQEVFDYLKTTNKSIALPYGFGCNLKNKGDWNRIYKMIMDTFSDYEKEVIIYKTV